MGEYARLYTLENFGVDIGGDDRSLVIDLERELARKKWRCKMCSKSLGSEKANKDHMRDKHGITGDAA